MRKKVEKVKRAVKKAVIRVERALEPEPVVVEGKPVVIADGPPAEEVLDALAAIAWRVDDYLAHGPQVNMNNRFRARLDTPGLREWVEARRKIS
jgi:hypothetical protein